MSNLSDFMGQSMEKIREMIDVNTIVGNPITTPDGTTLIPVSKVTFGFASGGSDVASQGQAPSSPLHYGAGSGAGVSVNPVAFVVVNEGNVRMLYLDPPAYGTIDRILDMVPGVIDKIRDMAKKPEDKKTDIVY